jgi:anaerobic glycerol-3-phosphate dehydrogenase
VFGLSLTGRAPWQTGVAFDAALQPTAGGVPVWANLFAAGDVLAGQGDIDGFAADGVALVTGLAAGRAAAKQGRA